MCAIVYASMALDRDQTARELMESMVSSSQWPGEGNENFVLAMHDALGPHGLGMRQSPDPDFRNRILLEVDIGDSSGEQLLVTTSHCDVVGVNGQQWDAGLDPGKVTEKDGWLIGRGTCDTHGSGVSMLLAGLREDVRGCLMRAGKKVTLLFTYDEEETSPELSMRGARMAAGVLPGSCRLVHATNYIAGEPTEIDGRITPMRAHKGRLLGRFDINAPGARHVAEIGPNALMDGVAVIGDVEKFARYLRDESNPDPSADIFNPPYSTIQVTAGELKGGDYSTAPSNVAFFFDMRTVPGDHEKRAKQLARILDTRKGKLGESHLTWKILKNGLGSETLADAWIVKIAEQATGQPARGFNGGDEGRIFRNELAMKGVTLGPGSLEFAHMANERVKIESLFRAADLYAEIFLRVVE